MVRHFGNKVTARVETMQYPEDIQISAGYYGNLDILVAKPIQTKFLHLFLLVALLVINLAQDVDMVIERIDSTIDQVVEEGFPEERVNAVLNSYELSLKHRSLEAMFYHPHL